MNKKELKRLRKFINKHKKHGSTENNESGLTIHYTAVGIAYEMYCQGCGKIKDITDYSEW